MKGKLGIVFMTMVLLAGTIHAAALEPTTHTVRDGDTLSGIAAQYMPYTEAYTRSELMKSIREINNISGPLSPGQVLAIPIAWKEPLRPRVMQKPKDFEARGLYMNPASSGSRAILDAADRLKKAGGNTLVFDAKDDMGAIAYRSAIPARYCPDAEYAPTIEELPKMIEYLHRKGIHVVARVVVFRDPIMARSRPGWCINRERQWLNPADPRVQEYLLAVIDEISDSGVDEVQLDYVRYHADGRDWAGREGATRADVIAGFLGKVHEVTAPKGVLLSVDMFGIVIWQRDVDIKAVGQDIAKITPHVDIISPMLYPSHFSKGFDGVQNPADDPYKFVFKGVQKLRELTGRDVVIRPWLQSFPLGVTKGFGPGYIRSQIDAARDAGGTGWLLWSPGNHYSDAYTAIQGIGKREAKAMKPSTASLCRRGAAVDVPVPD